MPIYHTQNVLNGGEISPLLRGRVDQPRYSTGGREMLNFVPMPQGGVTRRPGTRFLGSALPASGNIFGRLIPFVFSATQGRMLEFGDRAMRVWLPDGTVVADADGAPRVFDSPFAAKDLRELRYAQSADVIYFAHRNYAPRKLSRYADNLWVWSELTFMPGVAAPGAPALSILDKRGADDKPKSPSTTDYSYCVSAVNENGEESAPSPAAVINAEALNSVDYHIRVIWNAVPGAVSYRIYKKKVGVFGFIGRAAPTDIGTSAATLSGVTLNGYPCRRVTNIEVFSIGAFSLYMEIRSGTATRAYWYCDALNMLLARPANYDYWVGINNVPPSGMAGGYTSFFGGLLPGGQTKHYFGDNENYPEGYGEGYNASPLFTYTQGLYFDDKNIGADTQDTPIEHKNPFADEGNYPSQVFFHQQRLGFAATASRPITIWLSRTGEFESMASSVPPKDDDAIEVTLAATQANRIVWLQPDRNALAFGTEGSEWTLEASEGVVLTPSTASFQLQTSNGGDGGVTALSVGGSVLYVQRGSGAVRDFSYNYSADKYLGQDVTILARHVVKDVDIRAWAWQQEPFGVLWCALSDGKLAGLTYMKEQEIIGWHRHATDGDFLDVAGMPGTPDDQVWFLVRRGDAVFIERLEQFFDSGDLAEAYFLDSALNYQGPEASHFSGLSHLAGRRVQAFADGGTVDGLEVSNAGELALNTPAASAHIGLPYTSRLVPNLPEIQTQQGSSFMHNRKILSVRLRVYRSMSFLAGLEGELSPIVDRHIRSGTFSARPFFSEGTDLDLDVCGGWTDESPLIIEVSSATPLTILALLTGMEITPFAGKGGF